MPRLQREGVDLYYELDGSGPPILYISGFAMHSNDVLGRRIRGVLGQQYTVLAPDHRGAGQTTLDENMKVSIEDIADDINHIMAHHEIEGAHVLGISMGGCVAQSLALRHPQRVRSLILAVTTAWGDTPSRGLFMLETLRLMRDAAVPRELVNRDVAVILFGEEAFRHPDIIEAVINAPRDPHEQTRAGFYQLYDAIQRFDVRDQIAAIPVPTLVMSSPDDILIPPRYQDEVANTIPHAELKRYPGGHAFMMLPMHFDTFMQDVLAFWGGLS